MIFRKSLIAVTVLLLLLVISLPSMADDNVDEWLMKTIDLYEKDEYEKAIEYVDKIIETSDQEDDKFFGTLLKASIISSMGDNEGAMALIDKAMYMSDYPNDGACWFFKSYVLYNMGKFEESKECYDKSVRMDPTAAEDFPSPEEAEGSLKDFWLLCMGDLVLLDKLYACEENVGNIATAVEAYAVDHEGEFPESLNLITDGYMEELPVCPSCGKPYFYEVTEDRSSFLVSCGGENAHLDTGMVGEGYYPAFCPDYGMAYWDDNYSYDGNDDYYRLSDMIAQGKTSEFMEAIEENPDFINLTDDYESTFLHNAATANNKDICDFLITKGIDVNVKDYDGNTPLHIASSYGNKEVADFLIEKGADINAKNYYGQNPLYQAYLKDMAIFLIDKGAEIVPDYSGTTNLAMAASNGQPDLVEFYLEKGLSVNQKNDSGETPIYSAIYYGDFDTVSLFIDKGASVEGKDDYGNTPLHITSDLKIAELLIKNGADVNAVNETGETPLHLVYDNKDLAEMLLENGANIDAKTEYGETPLDYSIAYGYTDMVAFLISKGADTSAYPLHYAVIAGDMAKVKDLLKDGYDVNAKDIYGATPIHYATTIEMAELLLENGADINAADDYGSTALDKVTSEELRVFLIENGAEPGTYCGG